MEDLLKTVINELEIEKEKLLHLIDEAVKESEFLHAHFHTEALQQINSQLQTLKSLEDSQYTEKHMLAQSIERLNDMLTTQKSHLQAHLQRMIVQQEAALLHLNHQTKDSPKYDSKHIANLLGELHKRKIKRFKILLMRESQLVVDVGRLKQNIVISIGGVPKLRREYILEEEDIAKLRGLGFELSQRGQKLTLNLYNFGSESDSMIITTLSRVIFEVFYFKGLVKNTVIEVY